MGFLGVSQSPRPRQTAGAKPSNPVQRRIKLLGSGVVPTSLIVKLVKATARSTSAGLMVQLVTKEAHSTYLPYKVGRVPGMLSKNIL